MTSPAAYEDSPLARFYREAPLNSIWEGSSNVTCLDVLRSIKKQPDSISVLLAEIRAGASNNRQLGIFADAIETQLADADNIERHARRIVEMAAIGLQASLMVQYSAPEAADAFIGSRVRGEWGCAFGTLPKSVRCDAIIARSRLS